MRGPVANLGLKSSQGRPGVEKETSQGRERAAYSRATLLLRKQGVPGREKLRPLWVSQSQQGYEGRRTSAVRNREAATGEEARRLSCPEPRGLYQRHPSSGPGLCRRRRRAVICPALPRNPASPASGGGCVCRGRAPQPQDPAPGSSSGASQG